ncbi:MAG: DNA translocase FtsK [Oxalobacter sp.]
MTGRLPLSLLEKKSFPQEVSTVDLDAACHQIETVLAELGISAQIVSAVSGPVMAWYELELAEGVEPVKVTIHARDFAKALSAVAFRVVEYAAGLRRLAFEVPNAVRERIFLSDVLMVERVSDKRKELPVALGKDMVGKPVVADLTRMPHLLVGSSSGSENIGFLHAVILSLLCSKTVGQLRFLLMDVNGQGFSAYQGIPLLQAPVITGSSDSIFALAWAIQEMRRRFQFFKSAGVAGFDEYHQQVAAGESDGVSLPRVVMVINEYPNLFSTGREAEMMMVRLALGGHVVGIHLVLAAGRVSLDTVTDLIKLHIPSRIVFKVGSMTDSRRMVGQHGAEALLGQGDMLYLSNGGETVQRIHGVSVSDAEVSRITAYLSQQGRQGKDG